jgi:hypothetical protein
MSSRWLVALASLLLPLQFLSSCARGGELAASDDPNPTVWVNTGSGVYHCKGSQFYENTSAGRLTLESDARVKGYRPAKGMLCGDGTMVAVPGSAATPMTATALPLNPGPTVWVNTTSGVYHCPGSRYYRATKTEALMSERAAKAAGHRPSGGRACP